MDKDLYKITLLSNIIYGSADENLDKDLYKITLLSNLKSAFQETALQTAENR